MKKNIIISTYFLKKYLNRFVTVQNRNTEENEIIADSQATLMRLKRLSCTSARKIKSIRYKIITRK